jgi:mono/diheme cytochrome c family protein
MRFSPMRRFPAALIVGALTLAACGGGDQGARDTSDATSSAAGTTGGDAAGGTASLVATGEQKYGQICASCHMANGLGVEGNFPPLAGSEWLLGDPDVPISIVLHGLQGEIQVKGATYNGAMQPWAMLPDEDVAAILTYARQAWGNGAGPVTPAQVKAIRDKAGNRAAWTADELKSTYPGAGTKS